jgi:hypothetical protein
MNYNIQSEINWLTAMIYGRYNHTVAINFVRELILASGGKMNSAVLIDIRQLSGKSDILGSYEIGELFNAGKRQLNKIVMLCSQEHLQYDFLKTVLRNRGIFYKATVWEEEALKWLKKYTKEQQAIQNR